jgi:alginate O-acetyltransferase complex protein AlgI
VLFNSYEFICIFLPIVFGVFFFLAPASRRWARDWLIVSSIVFYACWNSKFVCLLFASALVNYMFGVGIARARPTPRARHLLIAALVLNLGCLGYFKYADFFISNYDALTHGNLSLLHIVLPLGISFFTFTQIAFLIDVYRGVAVEFCLANYILFVTYFPHLIAGPILHHSQMMPQFADRQTYRVRARNIVIGLTFFSIGLLKKLLLADNIGQYADASFSAAAQGPVLFLTAWVGVLAYSFQLYFDFSGYCDMAIGISRLFGIQLPINFNSPYKASSIVDFWRRWHITLSNFLRDYIYISLGGNREGRVRRHLNLLATMFLGGLWHGANWTFVIWGTLHGVLLVINHLWSDLTKSWNVSAKPVQVLLHGVSVALTFFFVTVLWAFFRAPSMAVAANMLLGMADQNGIALPPALQHYLQGPLNALHVPGVRFPSVHFLYPLGGPEGPYSKDLWIASILITFFCFNSQEIVAKLDQWGSKSSMFGRLIHTGWGAGLAFAFCYAFVLAGQRSVFLYFQF